MLGADRLISADALVECVLIFVLVCCYRNCVYCVLVAVIMEVFIGDAYLIQSRLVLYLYIVCYFL